MRWPSRATSVASNDVGSPGTAGSVSVSKVASRSQYSAVRNRIRARSRSTNSRVATDCTRPADNLGMTFFHSTGEMP